MSDLDGDEAVFDGETAASSHLPENTEGGPTRAKSPRAPVYSLTFNFLIFKRLAVVV